MKQPEEVNMHEGDPGDDKPETSAAGKSVTSRHSTRQLTSSADLILPMLIFTAVKTNPTFLCSHLNFIERYHDDTLMSGEESYVLTTFRAVISFIQHVDLSEIGLEATSHILRYISICILEIRLRLYSPELSSLFSTSPRPLMSGEPDTNAITARLREKVAKELTELTLSVTGVVDTGLGALKGFMDSPGQTDRAQFLPTGFGFVRNLTTAATSRPKDKELQDLASRSNQESLSLDTQTNNPSSHLGIKGNRRRAASSAAASLRHSRRDSDQISIRSISSIFSRSDKDKDRAQVERTVSSDVDRLSINNRLASLPVLSRNSSMQESDVRVRSLSWTL